MSEVKHDNQPNFPYEDISETNAELFTEIVSDPKRFQSYHSSATNERVRPYWAGLQAIHAAATDKMPDPVHPLNI